MYELKCFVINNSEQSPEAVAELCLQVQHREAVAGVGAHLAGPIHERGGGGVVVEVVDVEGSERGVSGE